MIKFITVYFFICAFISCHSDSKDKKYFRSSGIKLRYTDSVYMAEKLFPIIDSIKKHNRYQNDGEYSFIFFYPELIRQNVVLVDISNDKSILKHYIVHSKTKTSSFEYEISSVEKIANRVITDERLKSISSSLISKLQRGDTTKTKYTLDGCIVNIIASYRGSFWYFSLYEFENHFQDSLDHTVSMLISEIDKVLGTSIVEDCE